MLGARCSRSVSALCLGALPRRSVSALRLGARPSPWAPVLTNSRCSDACDCAGLSRRLIPPSRCRIRARARARQAQFSFAGAAISTIRIAPGRICHEPSWPVTSRAGRSRAELAGHEPSWPVTSRAGRSRAELAGHEPSWPVTSRAGRSRAELAGHEPGWPVTSRAGPQGEAARPNTTRESNGPDPRRDRTVGAADMEPGIRA